MKIRTIMAAAVTGIFLTAAGGSLAFGAEWTCPCLLYTSHDPAQQIDNNPAIHNYPPLFYNISQIV